MQLDAMRESIIGAIDGSRETIVSASRRIHARPELGKEEVFASSLLAETLEGLGFEVERGFAGLPTAFRARKGAPGGRRVAFLAEYDALPEIGHACGHNLICSSALAAGIGLGTVAAAAGGEVLVFGTPAEETDGAKVALAAGGCFDDLDAALMVHPYAGNFVLTESLAMDAIELVFRGRSTHAAATPWEGRNALDGVILTFNNLNALRQHLRPDARIHGIVTDGGAAPNVVPERAAARFYVRAARRDYLDELVARFRACAEAAASATGTSVEIRNYEASFDDMANSAVMAERFRDYAEALGSGPFRRAPDSFGSVDMGNVSQVVPAIHVLVDIADGRPLTAHTAAFREAAATTYAEETLIRSGKALALTGYDLLADPAFLASANAEFEATLGRPPARRR